MFEHWITPFLKISCAYYRVYLRLAFLCIRCVIAYDTYTIRTYAVCLLQ